MTNQVITSDEHVTLMLDAAAWRIEITLTPKSGVVIGCADYVITQNYGAKLSEEFVVRDSDGNITTAGTRTVILLLRRSMYGAVLYWTRASPITLRSHTTYTKTVF